MPKSRRLVSQSGEGFFSELGVQARLLWRLFSDPRINMLYKLLPMGSVLYLFFPFDFIGPIDDAFIIWLGSTLFIELCPPEVVEEHRAALQKVRKSKGDEKDQIDEGDIIDAKYKSND